MTTHPDKAQKQNDWNDLREIVMTADKEWLLGYIWSQHETILMYERQQIPTGPQKLRKELCEEFCGCGNPDQCTVTIRLDDLMAHLTQKDKPHG